MGKERRHVPPSSENRPSEHAPQRRRRRTNASGQSPWHAPSAGKRRLAPWSREAPPPMRRTATKPSTKARSRARMALSPSTPRRSARKSFRSRRASGTSPTPTAESWSAVASSCRRTTGRSRWTARCASRENQCRYWILGADECRVVRRAAGGRLHRHSAATPVRRAARCRRARQHAPTGDAGQGGQAGGPGDLPATEVHCRAGVRADQAGDGVHAARDAARQAERLAAIAPALPAPRTGTGTGTGTVMGRGGAPRATRDGLLAQRGYHGQMRF